MRESGAMASDQPDDNAGDPPETPPDVPGLLPPDGVAWPPEPSVVAAGPAAPDSLPSTARRPAGAEFADWRTMPTDGPAGYRGMAGAPPTPPSRMETWSVLSLVAALVGLLPPLWALPLAPVLAIAFGLVGRRVCALDPTRRGRLLATAGMLIGAATLAGVIATGRLG